MSAQRSIEFLTASAPASPEGVRDYTPEQRDALIRIALGYQAMVRATHYDRVVSGALSAERASLCTAVAEYAALRRSGHATPEQVLSSVKALTSALSTSMDPTTIDILGRLVLQAFLAGYYGGASRVRSPVDPDPSAHMR